MGMHEMRVSYSENGENRKKDENFVLKNWLNELLGRPRRLWEDGVTVDCNGFK
jgi:hypothetical protein